MKWPDWGLPLVKQESKSAELSDNYVVKHAQTKHQRLYEELQKRKKAAANAKLGLIVGYVGASHIADKEGHAKMLLAGKRSDDGRGADVVIEDMADLPPLVAAFAAGGVERAKGHATAGPRWLA